MNKDCDLIASLGLLLKAEREKHQLTQQGLARVMRIDSTTLSSFERGLQSVRLLPFLRAAMFLSLPQRAWEKLLKRS